MAEPTVPRRRTPWLAGLALVAAWAGSCAGSPPPPTAPDPVDAPAGGGQTGCARTSTGFAPLTDLAGGSYRGEPGGLYPGGGNTPPGGHLAAGLELARAIVPVNAQGEPAANGRFGFVSIGMSNTTQEFSTFVQMANGDALRHPRLVLVDGAQGGMTAADWMNPGCPCWAELDRRIDRAGLSAAQVATAWVKVADRQPASGWPAYARQLRDETVEILRMLRARFPNLRLAYLSSRIYAGYATTTLNPEPYAYESGFAMRWVIEAQLAGGLPFAGAAPAAPWIAWGPYLWADGLTPRSDGLTWACSELQSDGTHPSTSGRQKVAQMLLDFVRSDPTAREWYLAD